MKIRSYVLGLLGLMLFIGRGVFAETEGARVPVPTGSPHGYVGPGGPVPVPTGSPHGYVGPGDPLIPGMAQPISEEQWQQHLLERSKKDFESLKERKLELAKRWFQMAHGEEQLQREWKDVIEGLQRDLVRFSGMPEVGYTTEKANQILAEVAEELSKLYTERLKEIQAVPEAPKAPWEQ